MALSLFRLLPAPRATEAKPSARRRRREREREAAASEAGRGNGRGGMGARYHSGAVAARMKRDFWCFLVFAFKKKNDVQHQIAFRKHKAIDPLLVFEGTAISEKRSSAESRGASQ